MKNLEASFPFAFYFILHLPLAGTLTALAPSALAQQQPLILFLCRFTAKFHVLEHQNKSAGVCQAPLSVVVSFVLLIILISLNDLLIWKGMAGPLVQLHLCSPRQEEPIEWCHQTLRWCIKLDFWKRHKTKRCPGGGQQYPSVGRST